MKIFTIIILSIIALFGCKDSKPKIQQLVCVDSLGWNEENDEYFTGWTTLSKANNNIVITDGEKISIYNNADFTKIGNYSEVGRGPGEFLWVTSVANYDDTLFVCDSANKRISKFTDDGEFISVDKYEAFWAIQNLNGELYLNNVIYRESEKIFKYNGVDFELEYDLAKIEDESKIEAEKNLSYYTNISDRVLFIYNDLTIYELDANEKLIQIEFPPEFSDLGINSIFAIDTMGAKLILYACKVENKNEEISGENSKAIKEKLGVTDYIIVLDRDLYVEEIYKLPINVMASGGSMLAYDNYFIVSDIATNIIYKLK